MTRRPVFWLVFAALGIAGAVTAVRLFSVALPNISIDITMDRGAAIERASELSVRYGWGPTDDRSAASFGLVDSEVQTYVELEGGGADEFARLARRNVYQPYQWRVRRFAERRVDESLIRFTPQGVPYGFSLRLAEADPGEGNLEEGPARSVAGTVAAQWGVDLSVYQLLEASQETLPGGRLDHTFVFERTDETLADARFRLRIRVAGARASELTHFAYVPEAFSRRYADMRSTNDSIALVSQSVFILLFVLLGAGVGTALLLRGGWLEWRTALAWGGIIAVFFGLNTVNQLPLSWMAYDTALSSTSFVLQQIAGGVAIAIVGAPLLAFFLLAGESLGRRAFPEHVQQWRFWSPEVASSTTALGMTVAAYLLVAIQLGYVVLFYLGTQRLDGWWSPADALVQPDLLATYLPWLQAVSVALFASFWEESVFRAVPIACAALLGARYGRRGTWIWGAVAVQALVFAAGHANYPQQPPYARVVELTGPALVWGVVYVRFGLVPTILAHFLYDLAMVSVVLFESSVRLDQGVIVAVALVPLAIVLRARVRGQARRVPPEWAYNRAWRPANRAGAPPERAEPEQASAGPPHPMASAAAHSRRSGIPAWSVPVAGGVGLLLWLGAELSSAPPPRLWGGRAEAVTAARAELRVTGAPVDAWSVAATTTPGATQGREYVYEEAGAEAFTELAGTYFDVPQWIVRVMDWEAAPEDRMEEYRIWVGDEGVVSRVAHTVPEARVGAVLRVDSARVLAREAARSRLGLQSSDLREVEADETRRPNRNDWTFTFSEVGLLRGAEGEVRVQVRLAGEEVVDVRRFIQVPEAWERARREAQSRRAILSGGLAVLLAICFGAAAVAAVVVWSGGALATSLLWRLTLAALLGLTASGANAWPSTAAGFSTAQPWGLQAAGMAIVLLVLAVVASPAIGLVGSLSVTWLRERERADSPRGTAMAFGLLLAGVVTALLRVFESAPAVANYSGAATAFPILDEAARVITPYLLLTSGVLLLLAAGERFRQRPFVRALTWTVVCGVAIVAVPVDLQTSLPLWGLAALATGAVIVGGLRVCAADPVLVPGIVGTTAVMEALAFAWEGPHAGARVGGLMAAAVASALAWAWTHEMSASEPTVPIRASVVDGDPRFGG